MSSCRYNCSSKRYTVSQLSGMMICISWIKIDCACVYFAIGRDLLVASERSEFLLHFTFSFFIIKDNTFSFST
jgi:hypothetical protein